MKQPALKAAYIQLREVVKDAIHLGPLFPLHIISSVFARRSAYKLYVAGVGRLHVRKNSSDIDVIRQIFRERDYDLSGFPAHRERLQKFHDDIVSTGKIPLIVDAGANNGGSAIWFSMMFPECKIVALEPDPDNFQVCSANIATRSNIVAIEGAIGGELGSVALDRTTQSDWAVKTHRSAHGSQVDIFTIERILNLVGDGHQLFLVKIDIEGFESDLFSSNTEWLDQVFAVLIEPHDWMLPGQHSSSPLQSAMGARRFELLIKGENLLYIK
jgi:FkbM family methyltransferase